VITPETAFILCRFIFGAAALFLWGGAIYLGVLVPTSLCGGGSGGNGKHFGPAPSVQVDLGGPRWQASWPHQQLLLGWTAPNGIAMCQSEFVDSSIEGNEEARQKSSRRL
jgi:hypothetical protein